MNIDKYKILKPQNPGFFKDKGSRFISYAFNIKNEIEVSGYLDLIKKKEKTHSIIAMHISYVLIKKSINLMMTENLNTQQENQY